MPGEKWNLTIAGNQMLGLNELLGPWRRIIASYVLVPLDSRRQDCSLAIKCSTSWSARSRGSPWEPTAITQMAEPSYHASSRSCFGISDISDPKGLTLSRPQKWGVNRYVGRGLDERSRQVVEFAGEAGRTARMGGVLSDIAPSEACYCANRALDFRGLTRELSRRRPGTVAL
jgi:hypothetical protein